MIDSPINAVTEAPPWQQATRIIVLTSPDGVRQWRCEGLASNVTPEALELLRELLAMHAGCDVSDRAQAALVVIR